jgi:hypothetical protein
MSKMSKARTLCLEGGLSLLAIFSGYFLGGTLGAAAAGVVGLGLLFAWWRGREEDEEEFESHSLFGETVPAEKIIHHTESILPEFRPTVAPHGYGKHLGKEGHGLIITNPGYPAFNVHIPPATVGSLYRIVFPDRVPQLLERDRLCFFTAWLEHPTLPIRPGHDLFDVMRTSDIDQCTLDILYQDGDFRSYRSGCVIERDVWVQGGVNVRFTGQELLTKTIPILETPSLETPSTQSESGKPPDIEIQVPVMIARGSLRRGVTDLFVHVVLTLKDPSEVLIGDFSITAQNGTDYINAVAIDDVSEWEVMKENPDGGYFHTSCTPMPKHLKRRGDPVAGWIHFPLENVRESWLMQSKLWLKVNSVHGTCLKEVLGSHAFPDPGTKGVMRRSGSYSGSLS